MSKPVLIVFLLLAYLICASCKRHIAKKGTHTLHNYPIFEGQDCPDLFTRELYDPHQIKREAKILNMRPVDYLHAINSKKFKPIRKDGEVTKLGPYTLE